MTSWPVIEHANLQWRDEQPINNLFDDHYFARESGYAESHYVFLEHNRLPERWRNRDVFVIGETGFGSGLNFFCTAELWSKAASPDAVLYYYSVEKFPMRREDMRRVIQNWPELLPWCDELTKYYPDTIPGFHTIEFAHGRIVLVLMIGDALEMFSQVDTKIDAWYLDGFAPSKNPGMWNSELFSCMASRSKSSTTFATFTAAGFVRRGLTDAGFKVEKFPGFGGKREMLCGEYVASEIPVDTLPWYALPKYKTITREAIVIGGGISGATTAHVLAQRGWQVHLIEQHGSLAESASGNPAGVVMPWLTRTASGEGRIALQAFYQAVRWLNSLELPSWKQSGVIQLLQEDELNVYSKHELLNRVFQLVNVQQGSEITHVPLAQSGLLFSSAGYVSPRELCSVLVENSPLIKISYNTRIARLEWREGHWVLFDERGVPYAESPVVIVAGGAESARFEQTNAIPLIHVRGQIAYLREHPVLQQLQVPVCYDGYVIPTVNGEQCVGASFDPHSGSTELREIDQNTIFEQLYRAIPSAPRIPVSLRGRAAIRTASRDHLPIVGPVPVHDFYRENYRDVFHGKNPNLYPIGEYFPGLYINAAHGARGLVTAYLGARTVANQITGWPSEMPRDLAANTHPARFWLRDWKRKRLD